MASQLGLERVSESPRQMAKSDGVLLPFTWGWRSCPRALEVSLLINGKLGFPSQKAVTRGEREKGGKEGISGDMILEAADKTDEGRGHRRGIGLLCIKH